MGNFIDLTGKKFNRWLVLKRVSNDKHNLTQWLCRCDCGTERIVLGNSLRNGRSKSCGCYNREIHKEMKPHKVHGLTHTRIYNIWVGMKQRCYNPKASRYYTHGARGIKVYGRWRKSVKAFYNYVSKLPHFGEKGYTLNRIDNDGNYEPGNVEWSDDVTQANNKRNNRLVSYNGETKTMAQWARELGINYKILNQRINRDGLTFEQAVK